MAGDLLAADADGDSDIAGDRDVDLVVADRQRCRLVVLRNERNQWSG